MIPDDVIAAIATPLGEGGLAVIRLSGAQAFAVADKCFQPGGKNSLRLSAAPTHTIQFGKIVHDGKVIDEVLVAVLRTPRRRMASLAALVHPHAIGRTILRYRQRLGSPFCHRFQFRLGSTVDPVLRRQPEKRTIFHNREN